MALLGAAVVFFLGPEITWLLDLATAGIKRPPPANMSDTEWAEITDLNKVSRVEYDWKRHWYFRRWSNGEWIGAAERLLFFGAVYFKGWLLVPAWLGFKFASKWAVWQNLVKIKTVDTPDNAYTNLKARIGWGNWVYGRFIFGTLLNLVVAGAVAELAILLTDPVAYSSIGGIFSKL